MLRIKQASGQSRYDQIVHMIEQSKQMKSAAESKATHLADKLVLYTFAGSLLSFVLTRNVAKALSVLMVGENIDASPALSEADAGIAISDGADIAREIANITIAPTVFGIW